MASVFDVANWFLNYNNYLRERKEEDTEYITNLKLQKLLYYAQGSSLALRDTELFVEEIEAWAHGPVVPSVYRKYKKNEARGIDQLEQYEIEPEEEEVLIAVYDTFGVYSAWGLRNMTHEEDPWKDTEPNCVISKESIKRYFKENYVEKEESA